MSSQPLAGRGGRTLPRLHAVTNDVVLAESNWEARAIDVMAAGGSQVALHVRGRATDVRRLLEVVDSLLPHARAAAATLLVNDRVDLALVADVDGVHLGGRSLTVASARSVLGLDPWLGASCHDSEGVARARSDGVDYAFLGTIFATPSHPGVEGLGRDGLAGATEAGSGLPVIGIGGVAPEDAGALRAAGAYGVAVIRGIWGAPDPVRAVRLYLEGLGS